MMYKMIMDARRSGLLVFMVAGMLFPSLLHAQDTIADNMLLYQRSVGGWPKHIGNDRIDYTRPVSSAGAAAIIDDSFRNDATIDNNATTKEIRYLLKAYKQYNNKKYLQAAEKGIRYLLTMQNRNGGWPQFYPDTSMYRSEITYNDNAMINAMNVLWDVWHGNNDFNVVDPSLVALSKRAIERGIDCILKTQVSAHAKLEAWCAQYDASTLQPAKARSYELISLSGNESVGIVEFLMKVEHPTPAIKKAINAAVEWLQAVKIEGYKYTDVRDPALENGLDRMLVPDKNSTVWARFYDIETNKPFFSGRDGQKKWSVKEIEYERRTGYGWYGTWPKNLLENEYPEWQKKVMKEQ